MVLQRIKRLLRIHSPLRRTFDRSVSWIRSHTIKDQGIVVSSRKHYPYPEVSGYFIPTLLDWGMHDLAKQYARWLLAAQNPDGSWSDPSGRHPYTFDTGQILKGLIAIRTRMPEVDSAISSGCNWMTTQVLDSGEITTPDKTSWILPNGRNVSDNIHLYAVQPLLTAAELFNEPRFGAAAQTAINHYTGKNDLTDFNTLSHFHAYVIEALIDLGLPELAKKGMQAVKALQGTNGFIPAYPEVKWTCSTGLAQYASILYRLGDHDAAEKAFSYLSSLQNRSGGFYGSYGPLGDYFPRQEISWATKYFLDAFYWRIRKAFDRKVDIFLDSIDERDDRLQAVLSAIPTSGRARILDAGCGKGRYAKAVKSTFSEARVSGMDISDAILQFLPDNIERAQGSLLNIPFENNYFDFVYCVEALEHSIQAQAAIREMCRVLKPSCRLLIIDKNSEHLGSMKIEEWEQWFKERSLRNLMEQYCTDVSSQLVGYDGRNANGLFITWSGVKKPAN